MSTEKDIIATSDGDFLARLESDIKECRNSIDRLSQSLSDTSRMSEISQKLTLLSDVAEIFVTIDSLGREISSLQKETEEIERWLQQNMHQQFKQIFRTSNQKITELQSRISTLTSNISDTKELHSHHLREYVSLDHVKRAIAHLELEQRTSQSKDNLVNRKIQKLQNCLNHKVENMTIIQHFVKWIPMAHAHDAEKIVPERFDAIRGLRTMKTDDLFDMLIGLYNSYVARRYIENRYEIEIDHHRGHTCFVSVDFVASCDCGTDDFEFDSDSENFSVNSMRYKNLSYSTRFKLLNTFFSENELFVTFEKKEGDEEKNIIHRGDHHFIGALEMDDETHNHKIYEGYYSRPHCSYSEWNSDCECQCESCRRSDDYW